MTKEQGDAFIKECQAIADKAFDELVEKRKKMGRPIHESVRPKPNYRTDEFGNYTISFRRKESKGTPPHVLDYNRVLKSLETAIRFKLPLTYTHM